ncbi:blue-light photoreceptor PHR2-like, partial [Glycine max]|uniref:blue-light photoreceptor PHR2-like n=1 Tax=Glycine max TaxID=3847 RepID=UPI0002336CC7
SNHSFSLSTIFPFVQPKNIPSTTLQPSKLKVPTQASSLTHLSLSTTTPPPSKTSFKSTNPLHAPLSIAPHRPRDPPNATPLRRAALIWFCNDLRLLDNECLTATNNDSLSVLPIYFFDPSDYGKSASDFDKTGPYRAAFLIDSVSDLRRSLQARNSDLIVRVKKPETVLVELAKVSYPKCCKKEKRDKLLEMMEIAEVPDDAIHLNLCSFSLVGEEKRWLHSFKGNSLWTWEEVVEKFLKKYFPESKTAKGKVEISSFHQFPDESLSEALNRFHGLLRKTPTHGFNEPVQLNISIDGL